FSNLSAHGNIGEHLLVGGIDVVDVVRRVLEVANHLAGLRTNSEDAVREQAVETLTRPGIVWFGVARSPVNEIELGIVCTGTPRRASPLCPCVAILRPRFGAGFAGCGNRVPAPQFPAGIGIPAVEESARRGLSTRDSGNQHT